MPAQTFGPKLSHGGWTEKTYHPRSAQVIISASHQALPHDTLLELVLPAGADGSVRSLSGWPVQRGPWRERPGQHIVNTSPFFDRLPYCLASVFTRQHSKRVLGRPRTSLLEESSEMSGSSASQASPPPMLKAGELVSQSRSPNDPRKEERNQLDSPRPAL